jgi:hypothetical protein
VSVIVKRIGRFEIYGQMIERAPRAVLAVLNGCIVTRAEHMHHKDAIDYIAIAEHFEPIDRGAQVPWYDVTIQDLRGGKYHVTWAKR